MAAAAAATSLTFNQLFVANATAAVAHKNAETTEKRETDRKRKKKKWAELGTLNEHDWNPIVYIFRIIFAYL